ncbi:MAG: hypothetical protein Q9171_000172 [Xanthocarpia ochracea]
MTSPARTKSTHTVGPGEYLWAIGQRYGVSEETLAAANGLIAPFHVEIGQVLYLPFAENDVDMDDEQERSSKPGDGNNKAPTRKSRPTPAYVKADEKRLRTTTRLPYGRMQYRNGPAQEWIDIGAAFESASDTSLHPEPWNVQQVMISDNSIIVKQYGDTYKSQKISTGSKDVLEPTYGWQVTFKHDDISELVLCQWEEPAWRYGAEPGKKEQFYSIRFKYTGAHITSYDVSEIPTPAKQEDLGWTEEMKKDLEVNLNSSAQFPLADFTKDPATLVGKEIRLAFLKGGKKGNQFVWPQVIYNLMGQPFKFSQYDADNLATLNTYAEKKKNQLGIAQLRKVVTDNRVEWAVVKNPPKVSQPAKDAMPVRSQHPASSQRQLKRTREEDPLEQLSNKDLEERLYRAGIDLQEKLSACRKAETLHQESEEEWEKRKREKRQV